METLFDSNCRYMSDSELIYEITNSKQIVAEAEQREYDLNSLFSSLTPGRKKVALAAVEIYKRQQSKYSGQSVIRCSQDICALMQPFLWDLPNEEFWILALNYSSRLVKKVRVSVGGINQTTADIRLIMRVLVETGATQCVAVHNHPSGNKNPSEDDKRITEKLKKATDIFNIHLIDHVIIAGDTYYSFGDDGLL